MRWSAGWTRTTPHPRTSSCLIQAARPTFAADVAKACHRGSADFSTLFLAAANPIATVSFSGDNEPHAHPRADSLGTIGIYGRGPRPLIFSTELARSAKEAIKHPFVLQNTIKELAMSIDKETDGRMKASLEKKFDTAAGLAWCER